MFWTVVAHISGGHPTAYRPPYILTYEVGMTEAEACMRGEFLPYLSSWHYWCRSEEENNNTLPITWNRSSWARDQT